MKTKLLAMLPILFLAATLSATAQTGTLVKMTTTASSIRGTVNFSGNGMITDASGTYMYISGNTFWLDPDANGKVELKAYGTVTLTSLAFREGNQLTSLDVSACTELTYLGCNDSHLESLDVSACTELTDLDCGYSHLESLDVSTCTKLQALKCGNNQLTSLDVSKCTKLAGLFCGNNHLESLDVSACTKLTMLECCINKLKSLDVSACPELVILNCHSNQLTSLNIAGCEKLNSFQAGKQTIATTSNLNPIKYTNTSGKEELTIIEGTEYKHNAKLPAGTYEFSTTNPKGDFPFSGTITVVEVPVTLVKMKTNSTSPIYVSVTYSGGRTLKDANGVTLNNGSFTSNLMPDDDGNIELIASGEVTLTYLVCSGIQLTSLDVSKCTELTTLQCGNNQLTNLNVSGCTNLVDLYCERNQLTSLDVSKCPKLTGLNCSGNQLTTLNISGRTLSSFDAAHQTITITDNKNPVKYTNASGKEEPIIIDKKEYEHNAILPAGANTFTTTTPVPDRNPFSGTITVPASNDATLANLTVSQGTLNPAFSAATTSYTVSVANSIGQITIGATANDGNANVAGAGSKSLNIGSNPFSIVVTAEDGTEKTYTVTVTRAAAAKSNDATLKGLTVSQGTLSPAFSAATTSYTVSVANSIDQITIGATANDGNASVAGTGNKSLNVGSNPFSIVVTAEDGTTKKTYTVTVTRDAAPKSNDATLKGLTVSQGTLSPAFSAAITNYTVSVANNIEQITIGATANDANASVAGAGSKTLTVGSNPFEIVVTAEDGTTKKTYTVTVTRVAAPVLSNDATLKGLTVNQGTLSPAFSAAITNYTVSVDNHIEQITIGATANDANASVDGAGIKTLVVGDNLFDMVVTAEDGTTETYTVNVIRKDPTGMEDVNAADIKIYQSNSILYIESSEYIKDIRLHDTSGSLVFRKINAGHSINVPVLSKGVHILTVVTAKGETTRKINN